MYRVNHLERSSVVPSNSSLKTRLYPAGTNEPAQE